MILSKLKVRSTYQELASEYKISKSTIQNWKKQPKRKVIKTHKSKIDMEQPHQDIEQYPDHYQRERAVRFNYTQRAISIALKRLKMTQKRDSKPLKLNTRAFYNNYSGLNKTINPLFTLMKAALR